MIMLKDQTRKVVPQTMGKALLEREHLAHSGVTRMSKSIGAKYFWLCVKADVKRIVDSTMWTMWIMWAPQCGGMQAISATSKGPDNGAK